jgi:hypothetical protein
MIMADTEGFRRVGDGFFLHDSNGGGKMGQIWIRAGDGSVQLSDRLFWKADSVLCLLVTGSPPTLSEFGDLTAAVQRASLPKGLLSNDILVISHLQPPDTSKIILKGSWSQFAPCTNTELTDARMPVLPSYDPACLERRFVRGTRYVLVRPDLIAFSQAANLNDLEIHLEAAKKMALVD